MRRVDGRPHYATYRSDPCYLTVWVIQFGREDGGKHHSALCGFFSQAKWDTDALSEILLKLVLPFLPPGALRALPVA